MIRIPTVRERKASTTLNKPVLFTEVMNATVKDMSGRTLGRLHDIVLDPNTGRARFAIIKRNEADSTRQFTPVPWSLITLGTTGEKHVTLKVEREKFESAHKLSHWPDYNTSRWGPQVYAHYGLDYSAPVGAGGTGMDITTMKREVVCITPIGAVTVLPGQTAGRSIMGLPRMAKAHSSEVRFRFNGG